MIPSPPFTPFRFPLAAQPWLRWLVSLASLFVLALAFHAPARAQLKLGLSVPASAASAPTPAASSPEALAAAKAEERRTEKELKTATAEDETIEARVRARLLRSPEFAKVIVEVNGGIVRLSGTVSNDDDRRRLPNLVKGIQGVTDVDNNVRLSAALSERWDAAWELIKDRVTRMIAMVPAFILALLLMWLFMRLGRWVSSRPRLLGWQTQNPYLSGVMARTISLAFTLAGVLIALDLLGATALVGAVIGSAGVMGIVVGFAFRDVAENYLAGILLSLRRPFAPGDHIVVGDKHEGKVMSLNARATALMTLDGNHLRLPNAMVFKEVILNYTRNPRRRLRFTLGVGDEQNLVEAQRIGVDVMSDMKGVLLDPAPRAMIRDTGPNNSIQLEFFAWIDQREADFGRVRSEALRLVLHALQQAGLQVPQPIQQVRLMPAAEDDSDSGVVAAVQTAAADEGEVAPPQEDVSVNRELDAQMAEVRARDVAEHSDLLTHKPPPLPRLPS